MTVDSSIAVPRNRACHVCSHLDVKAINEALVEQKPIVQLVRQYGLSRDSLYRHHARHLRPALAASLVESPDLRPVALVDRIATIANRARNASAAAYAAGNSLLGARLGEAELKALNVLSDRFRIDHDSLAEDASRSADDYRTARALAGAIDSVAEKRPDFADMLAGALEADGRHDLASILRDEVDAD